MMVQVDTADSRFAKAVAIADQASHWLKCRTVEGGKAYGVPSQSTPDHYHLTTQTSCSCEDQRRHPDLACKHRLAVVIHCARVAGKPMPASDTIDGLAEMVAERNPVLTMVRHEDGEITWERHEHASGETYSLPRPVADAATYERIFGRL